MFQTNTMFKLKRHCSCYMPGGEISEWEKEYVSSRAAEYRRECDEIAAARREICIKMERANPLPDVAVLRRMKVSQLKELAIARGIKGGRSWPNACPPASKKKDILNELMRKPGDPRPKTAGKGWLPPKVQKLEDDCVEWIKKRIALNEGDGCDNPYSLCLDDQDCCVDGVHMYKNNKVLQLLDDGHDAWCTVCQDEFVDHHEWHCAGCNKCNYGANTIPCETCTPALYFCACMARGIF